MGIIARSGIGRALVKGHDDVRAKGLLDLHGILGCDQVLGAAVDGDWNVTPLR